ncbi:MAG: aminotransferase class V-fold PLP-dependent enzyme [Alphaproteobacteria bacterium]|nr:MAG: aminotransferase class V-fold PLP-dependent enzyme [Alphaproteobacteria bacterium]TMJ85546.1 MAG: aminotransferase class V-fold PLP-dependent enzyme [Alphaproteobacteria bacterium]
MTNSIAARPLPSQRHLFDIPDDIAFLNCAYLSPLPKASLAAGERGLWRKAQPWSIAPADFFTSSEAVRKLFARLINAEGDDVAFAPAVSYGMAQAAHNIPIRKSQTIVTLSEQFPSNVYPWMDVAERTGAAFVSVPRPGDDDWTSALLSAIEASTGIVAVPHCHWTDGGLIDLEAIGAACRRVGAVLCVDATQSVGALPLDVKRIDPDFVAVASYKWLLGPYSLGFLYVAPRWQSGRPIEHNWIARKDSEDFAGLVNYSPEFQAGARRFDVGERSNFALMPVAEASLRLLSEWTVPRVLETLRRRTHAIAERAHSAFGIASVPAHRRAGHYLGLRFSGGIPSDLPMRLAAANVFVSVRGQAMRVTPHVWNTDEDVEKLFAVLKTVLA